MKHESWPTLRSLTTLSVKMLDPISLTSDAEVQTIANQMDSAPAQDNRPLQDKCNNLLNSMPDLPPDSKPESVPIEIANPVIPRELSKLLNAGYKPIVRDKDGKYIESGVKQELLLD